MDDSARWERLCRLLDDDEPLWPHVHEALDEEGDPWGALLDGLDDAGALAALTADDTGMELADALAQLPRVHRLKPDLRAASDVDDLGDALALADRILARDGFRLLLLEEDDEDARSLVVVPDEATAEIAGLASALKRSIISFG